MIKENGKIEKPHLNDSCAATIPISMCDTSNSPDDLSEDPSDLDVSANCPSEKQKRRYEYLLEQTNLFRHFINYKEGKSSNPADLHIARENNEFPQNKLTKEKRKHDHLDEVDPEFLQPDLDNDQDNSGLRFAETPPYIKHGKMRDYQVQGLNWLISLFHNDINGILADEMGLGKTLQSISFLGYLKHFRNTPGPHLIVAPKSTLTNWLKEVQQWIPDFNVFIFHGDKQQRQELIKERIKPLRFEILITSYEMCIIEKAALGRINWRYIIIDEAHRIKNENSLLSKIVRFFPSSYRLLLTGTPLQNNLHELWALLNFLLPDVFSSIEEFDQWIDESGKSQNNVVQQLRKLLSPFLLRRLKLDVEKALLPKKEIYLYIQLSDMQRLWYQKVLEKDIDAVNGSIIGSKKESKTRLMNMVMQLRKVCNHPYLFEGAEPGPPYTNGDHIIQSSGKMIVLDKLLATLKATGSRVLIFSQMSRVLDILEDYCFLKHYDYCRLDGQTSSEDRAQAIDDFNEPRSKKFIFLLTTRAGGLGINLTTADVVILFDSDWNPQVDLQAQDRAHRIGQTKQVKVFRFVCENTVEEKVLERALQKLRLDQLVIQQGRHAIQPSFSKNDLLGMIRHGVHELLSGSQKKSEDSLVLMENLLQRGEEKTLQLQEKYKEAGFDDLQRFSSDQFNTLQWEGEDYSKKRDKAGAYLPILSTAKRERKSTFAPDGLYGDSSAIIPKFRQQGPRPKVYDFHFPSKRLKALIDKDSLSRQKGTTDNNIVLTQEEMEEMESLIEENKFTDWSKKDFTALIKSFEKYGRNNLEEIAREIETKTYEQVKEYSLVFWKEFKKLDDYPKIIASIEKGEAKLEKLIDIQKDLVYFVKNYHSSSDFSFPKSVHYTHEEDIFLVTETQKIGYHTTFCFEKLKEAVRRSKQFQFDWFLKTRTVLDLTKRLQIVVPAISKWVHGKKNKK